MKEVMRHLHLSDRSVSEHSALRQALPEQKDVPLVALLLKHRKRKCGHSAHQTVNLSYMEGAFFFASINNIIHAERILDSSQACVRMEAIFGSSSTANVTTWEAGPTTRGSYGILISCIIILVLCVWTAMHPNLPARNEQP